jgi:hypothetical protein
VSPVMRFRFLDRELAGRDVISVDGLAPNGPNFSHWPGNRTPHDLKRDTSTGIALALADLGEAPRRGRLGGLEIVVNDHFDTDGVLACHAVLDPESALRHRQLLVATATCGDFQVFTTEDALAIDLALSAVGSDDGPFGDRLRGLTGASRGQMQYELALAATPGLLAAPRSRMEWIATEFAAELEHLEIARTKRVGLEFDPELSLAIVRTAAPLRRRAINTVAGDMLRVLMIVPHGSGHLYLLHERVESWFELVSRPPLPRHDLAPLATRLDDLESPESDPRWRAGSALEPVPECFFGLPAEGRFGAFGDGQLCVSRLPPRLVVAAVREHYTTAPGRARDSRSRDVSV